MGLNLGFDGGMVGTMIDGKKGLIADGGTRIVEEGGIDRGAGNRVVSSSYNIVRIW